MFFRFFSVYGKRPVTRLASGNAIGAILNILVRKTKGHFSLFHTFLIAEGGTKHASTSK